MAGPSIPTSRTRNPVPELTERDRAWLAHHRAWLASGHTAKQYAALHGLSLTALYQSRYRPHQRGVGEPVGKRRPAAPVSPTSAFVPIDTVRAAAPVDAEEVRYPLARRERSGGSGGRAPRGAASGRIVVRDEIRVSHDRSIQRVCQPPDRAKRLTR